MHAHGSKFGVKTRPQNRQKLEKVVGKIEIFLAQKSDFLCSKFDFLQRLSDFQEIRENLNGFPLSEKSRKILSTAANIRKIAIRASYFPPKIAIFRDKIIGSWNTKDRRLEYE